MLFYSFFKTLENKEVVVELKNDLTIRGNLHSIDQFLNIKLHNIQVTEEDKYPYLGCLKSCFIRGSTVRYVQLPANDVDSEVLQEACRREQMQLAHEAAGTTAAAAPPAAAPTEARR